MNTIYPKINYQISFSSNKKIPENTQETKKSRYIACMLGGAIGDALGAPVEFYTYDQITNKFGNSGLRYLVTKSHSANITDDTQMMLFSAEGLLKSALISGTIKSEPDYNQIYSSYLDWYKTQTADPASIKKLPKKGLLSNAELYVRRFPGKTCIKALEAGKAGSINSPVNNSAGNGAIMRSAPFGLMYSDDPKIAFDSAEKSATLTHGNPAGYLPAGMFAALIAYLINGNSLEDSINKSLDLLKQKNDSDKIVNLIERAISLAKTEIHPLNAIESLGKGTTGDQALAIAIYCSLKNSDSYKEAVLSAINHSGDSDTVGLITGNIMGAYLGIKKIPNKWINRLQLSNTIENVASDLYLDDEIKELIINKKNDYSKDKSPCQFFNVTIIKK